MKKALLLAIFLFVLGCNQKTEVSSSEVKDLIPRNQYAILIVESESCIYCKQLKKDLQSEKLANEVQGMDVYSILSESNGRVRYMLEGKENISTEEELARNLKVNSFPQLFFYDRMGKVILHLPGYQPPNTLACSIRFVKSEAFKNTTYMQYMRSQECL